MKNKLLVVLFVLLGKNLLAQSITFEKTYPYYPTDHDLGKQVITTHDGGYALRTQTNYLSAFDPINVGVIKLDSMGNQVWEYHFSIVSSALSHYMLETKDHGFLIAGIALTDTGVGNYDVWLLKLDSIGQFLWTKTISAQNWVGGINEILKLLNGNILISTEGYGKSNLLLIDENGVLLKWNSYNNFGRIAQLRYVNDSILNANAGIDTTLNRFYWCYITLSDSGVLKSKLYWNYPLDSLYINSGPVDKNGSTYNFGPRKNAQGLWGDRVVVKIDSIGNIIKIAKLNLDFSFQFLWCFDICSDDGFILGGGISAPNPQPGSGWLYRFDSNCDSVWFKYIANSNNNGTFFEDVIQTSDSGFIGAGIWEAGSYNTPYAVKTDKNGNVNNLLATKEPLNPDVAFNLYPNPADELTYVFYSTSTSNALLTIINLQGQLMHTQSISKGNLPIHLNTRSLPSGFYLCTISEPGQPQKTKKMLVTHAR